MVLRRILFIVLVTFLTSCSLLSKKERTVSCDYHDTTLTLTCTGKQEDCKVYCENLLDTIQFMDAIKFNSMNKSGHRI